MKGNGKGNKNIVGEQFLMLNQFFTEITIMVPFILIAVISPFLIMQC